jgi:isopentenyl-diphosphate delta-isomerase
MTVMIPAWVEGELVPVEKLDAHKRALRHKAVSVFVLRGDKTLIQQRAAGKYHSPLQWANACCTHPFWDETGLACATRRLQEELGLTGLTLTPRPGIEYRADVGQGLTEHEVVEVFTAHAPLGVEPVPNPEEVAATEWVGIDDLRARIAARPADFSAWLRIYVGEHLEEILGRAA